MLYATVKKWLPQPLDTSSEQVTNMRIVRELPVARTNMRSRATVSHLGDGGGVGEGKATLGA